MDVKYAASAWPQLGNKAIAEAIQKNIDRVGAAEMDRGGAALRQGFPEHRGRQAVIGLATEPVPLGGRPQATSSNDNGDVSWVVPAGLFEFPGQRCRASTIMNGMPR